MRITGGTLCGRRVVVPARGVRPTQDRVREAVFGSLAARIPGCRFLDLFAGSGAAGLEAWSRGASGVVWVDQSPAACAALRKNVESLCLPGQGEGAATVVCSEVFRWLLGWRGGEFDVVFADPPYETNSDSALARKLPAALGNSRLLAPGGLLVIEEPAGRGEWETPSWHVVRDRRYGMSRVVFLEPTGPGDRETEE
jgi:16S rRNA (guanine966-N2)-methyltransferase